MQVPRPLPGRLSPHHRVDSLTYKDCELSLHDLELLSLCEECCGIDQRMKGIYFLGQNRLATQFCQFTQLKLMDGLVLIGPVVFELELSPRCCEYSNFNGMWRTCSWHFEGLGHIFNV